MSKKPQWSQLTLNGLALPLSGIGREISGATAAYSDILPATMDPQQKMKEMLAELWKQHRPAIEERVDILERACDAVGRGQLSVQEREEAQSAAHKLAGVLGTFGRTEGTNLARQIENWLADPETLPTRIADFGKTLAALRNSIS